MNLPPISSSFASSLAGSVKSSGDKASSDAAQSNTVEHQAAQLQVDGVIKSNASGDSEADGRQLLDTFEQHSNDEEEPHDPAHADQQDQQQQDMQTAPQVNDGDKPQRPRLDLQA